MANGGDSGRERRIDRRTWAARLGAGAVGFSAAACHARGAATGSTPSDIGKLAVKFRDTPRDDLFDVAWRAVRGGADHRVILGAVFLAGVHGIRPRPHGILHAVMAVESAFCLAEGAPPRDALHSALWALDDLKRPGGNEAKPFGAWTLPSAPRAVTRDPTRAREDFVTAMAARDPERADRALVALLPHHDHESMFEILWPLAARSYAFIGHKPIYAAQVERVLRRIGWQHAAAPLRSLVMALLVDERATAFERSTELAAGLPDGWARGRADPDQSIRMLASLRTATPEQAQDLVVDAVDDGLAPSIVWDALRLLGSEVFWRRTGRRASSGRNALLPVHAVTVVHALHHGFRTVGSDATQRVLLLQAAAWSAALRDDLGRMVGLSMDGPGLESLGAETTGDVTPETVFATGSPHAACAMLERNPDRAAGFRARLRAALRRTAIEHHQHKYTAAIEEESERVARQFRARILAPAIDYIAHPDDDATELFARAEHAIGRAGVR